MDLSWEAMWQNHRRQLEDDLAALDALAAEEPGDAGIVARGVRHALNLMGEAERHRAPIA